MYKRKLGQRVSPSSLCEISRVVSGLREDLHRRNIVELGEKHLNMCKVVERMQDDGLIELIIEPDTALPNAEAECYENRIRLRESVYLDAANDGRRALFTIAHELGHAMLHCEEKPTGYGFQANPDHPIYCDSEWQADTFAGIFLAPTYLLPQKITAAQIFAQYSLSMEAALVRVRILSDERKRAAMKRHF